ncbi:MAG: hypothetical protein L6R43_06025 [Planctomycetes bacterium]|nr:hypothetical protein [Planctomycetota bacterium]
MRSNRSTNSASSTRTSSRTVAFTLRPLKSTVTGLPATNSSRRSRIRNRSTSRPSAS